MSKKYNMVKKAIYGILPLVAFNALKTPAQAAPIIDPPTEPVPTRVLVNPSFEEPSFSNSGPTWISLDNYIPGNYASLQGWFSTHPTTGYSRYGEDRFTDSNGNPFIHLIELWVNSNQGVTPANGTQFAELNAESDSALYQDIVVFAGESIPWSASHRGRAKDDVADVAEVFISDPNDWTGPKFFGDKLYAAEFGTSRDGTISGISPLTGNIANSNSETALANGWVRYADTWEGPSESQEYRFAFQSISTGSGNNTVGNFLDDIQIKLSPLVDFVDPNIDSISPFGDSTYFLPIRINGQSESASTVEIDVAIAGADFSNFSLSTLVSGTNQPLGSGFAVTKLANGNISVSIPADLYDPNNPNQYISVPINFAGTIVNQDSEVLFSVIDVSGGGGQGVQDLLIPPADSGFLVTQSTTLKAGFPD